MDPYPNLGNLAGSCILSWGKSQIRCLRVITGGPGHDLSHWHLPRCLIYRSFISVWISGIYNIPEGILLLRFIWVNKRIDGTKSHPNFEIASSQVRYREIGLVCVRVQKPSTSAEKRNTQCTQEKCQN
jgi:hypothetical protein